jgi:hypothetical protein
MVAANIVRRLNLAVLLLLFLHPFARAPPPFAAAADDLTSFDGKTDGYANLQEGSRLFQLQRYDEASAYLWRAVLLQEQAKEPVRLLL